MDEGISQSEEDISARDGSDEGSSQGGKDIAMDSSSSSGDDENGGNGGEEVSGDDSNNGEITMLREGGPMVLVKTNEVVLLCHEIQIIMPHRILLMEVD